LSNQQPTDQSCGQIIAKDRRAIKRINKITYRVKSQSNGNYYHITATDIGWKCDCADHKFRGEKCKHTFLLSRLATQSEKQLDKKLLFNR
jgi:hypothetical protein